MVPLKENVLIIFSFSSGCRDTHTDNLNRATFDILENCCIYQLELYIKPCNFSTYIISLYP
jgi:hypothetical protein